MWKAPSILLPLRPLLAWLALLSPATLAQVAPGHRLISPQGLTETQLIDNAGTIVHTWPSSFVVGISVYMKEDGNLLRTIKTGVPGAGAGGGLQELDLEGNVLWDFRYDTGGNIAHHDIEPLPNGNVLMIAWETFSAAAAIDAGRNPALVGSSFMPDHIIEVQPSGPTTGTIVWEWHVFDHLIQDFDSSKANFGDVAAHPELIDINYPASGSSDFNHFNSVDFDPVNDWVLLSANAQDEAWIIDHSTTSAEAAGHTGGNRGKGGDLLYRWGNPAAYRAGTVADQQLFFQHSVKMIPPGYPGAGNITIFNNQFAPSSTLFELVLPLDGSNNFIFGPGGTYGPAGPLWSYSDPMFDSFFMSSAERLPNGNTLVCSAFQAWLFEIDDAGTRLWEYDLPPSSGLPFHATYIERTLWDDGDGLSASSGGNLDLDVIAGTPFGGDLYLLLGSASGTTPGFNLQGFHVPLNIDAYFNFGLNNINGGVLMNSFGNLDASGKATGTLALPPGLALAFVGSTVNNAMLILEPVSFALKAVTNVESFELLP